MLVADDVLDELETAIALLSGAEIFLFSTLSRKALGHSASYLVGIGSSLLRWWHGKILHTPVHLLGSVPNCAQGQLYYSNVEVVYLSQDSKWQ